ncbi:hypothetical protein DV737_g4777, partial [Chaetothyriales sp. CBS 132003]
MIVRKVWLLAACFASAWADVEFLTPAAGSSHSSLTLSITWEDSGTDPAISDLTSYQMYLCAGGNDADEYADLTELVEDGDFSTGYSVNATVTTGLGANVENAYFIKMVSTATGGAIVNFSDRFSLTGMTGDFTTKVVTGLKTVTGTDGPTTINDITTTEDEDESESSTTDTALYTTPYTLQSGTVRYAPMPPTAATSITAKSASSQWPTSAYTVYTTYAGTPNAITTHTLAQTYSVSSREATPTDNAMQKFLNRWKD